MSNKIIVAIDPGASGGIAVQYPTGKSISYPMHTTEGDLLADLRDIQVSADLQSIECVCYLENLVKFAGGKGSGKQQTGSGMAVYASNWGFIKGVAMALKWRLVLVTPQKWQKELGLGTRGKSSKTEWKNKLKGRAQQLYPDQKVTLKTADALLILEWAKRNNNGGFGV